MSFVRKERTSSGDRFYLCRHLYENGVSRQKRLAYLGKFRTLPLAIAGVRREQATATRAWHKWARLVTKRRRRAGEWWLMDPLDEMVAKREQCKARAARCRKRLAALVKVREQEAVVLEPLTRPRCV